MQQFKEKIYYQSTEYNLVALQLQIWSFPKHINLQSMQRIDINLEIMALSKTYKINKNIFKCVGQDMLQIIR